MAYQYCAYASWSVTDGAPPNALAPAVSEEPSGAGGGAAGGGGGASPGGGGGAGAAGGWGMYP